MAIRGVTFDWWGTIAVIPPREEAAPLRDLRLSRLEAALRGRGADVDSSILREAYERQGKVLEDQWAAHRELSSEEQTQLFLRFAGLDPEDAALAAAVADALGGAILHRRPGIFPNLEPTMAALAERGLAIGLLSNTGRSWGRYLSALQEDLGIGRFFRFRGYSDELRLRKPDPRIFRAAANGLGLAPEEVVHVGDDVTADVAGAAGVGMRAVWFNTGFWPGAATDRADAEIRDHAELPSVLEGLR
ncbi:MAG TPA: HAD family hydrolase [Thermoplasmata archaeon]|jgi:putative hydrolase of the HAD superfamily|nr:HAD family hydrolase [Thermoplasmata archaeon]